MKNDKLHTVLLLIAIILMAISFLCVYNRTPKVIEKTDTVKTVIHDTITRDTTIYEKQVVPKKVVETKRDTVFTPAGDSLLLVTEKKTFEKRLTMGLDTADVEVTTEGINTSLSELKMRLRLHQVNTQEVVEVTKYVEHKKLRITPQVGMGYGVFNKQCDMYIGLGFSYNF
jgi:hypothetical protein